MDKQKEMIEMCKALRLPSIRSLLEQEALFEQHTSPTDFLYFALKQEMEDRYVRAKANRIRLANFPEKKLLEELDVEALSKNTMMHVYSHITTSTQEDAMENFATYIDNQ